MKGNEVIVSKLFKKFQTHSCLIAFLYFSVTSLSNWVESCGYEKHNRKSKYFEILNENQMHTILVFNWNLKMALNAYIFSVIFHPVGNGVGTQCHTWYYKECTLVFWTGSAKGKKWPVTSLMYPSISSILPDSHSRDL